MAPELISPDQALRCKEAPKYPSHPPDGAEISAEWPPKPRPVAVGNLPRPSSNEHLSDVRVEGAVRGAHGWFLAVNDGFWLMIFSSSTDGTEGPYDAPTLNDHPREGNGSYGGLLSGCCGSLDSVLSRCPQKVRCMASVSGVSP